MCFRTFLEDLRGLCVSFCWSEGSSTKREGIESKIKEERETDRSNERASSLFRREMREMSKTEMTWNDSDVRSPVNISSDCVSY